MTDKILLDVADQIATVTFDNLERRNAITFEMWHDLRRILVDLKHDDDVRVIVFRGAGDKAFSAGADISEFETRRKNAAQATLYNAAFDAAMDEAEAVGKPTISMVKGLRSPDPLQRDLMHTYSARQWQLFAKLRRGGQVKSVRGPGGGYLLARSAADTRISDIILSVDEPIRATRCSPGSPKGCTGTSGRCVTHDLWEELGNQIHLFLSSVTVADVCENRVLGTSGILHRNRMPAAEAR